ncbi:hypothetical protein Slala03_36630 [Streptomyces lavendulae subsp. lavendulae]|uniref:hypothetical protein n=1 Tax=Streptomyces lavendulae TaxID=1914 RepID=UPI0024A06F83|nr:hypothetical protein [Streptomyces lavendulae]GLV83974.1 hypothetical protein Slala03_36630 [Streptomyces lavendulae subsp. lavendulae]GLX37905.1 hypothetical protein Sros01_39780 [Streptomyces roseochromogenus]
MDTTAPAERDRRAYVAPLVSTLLTLPAAAVTLFFAGLSPMACDSCEDAASDRFDASFGPAWTVFTGGLVLVLLLLVACWALPRNRGNRGRRLALALAAPGAVVLNVIVFAAMVDWP